MKLSGMQDFSFKNFKIMVNIFTRFNCIGLFVIGLWFIIYDLYVSSTPYIFKLLQFIFNNSYF